MGDEYKAKLDMLEIGKRVHGRGWIAGTEGNFSVRLDESRIITTPSGVHKGYLSADDFVIVNMEGKPIGGKLKPSSELDMHLACYRLRADIGAVIHVHPTFCVAISVAGVKLEKPLLPEVVFTLGSIPTADYAPPATRKMGRSVEKLLKDFDAIILERHGSLTVGKDLFDAYNKLERMEHVAEITCHARQLGKADPLTDQQVEELLAIKKSLGIKAPRPL